MTAAAGMFQPLGAPRFSDAASAVCVGSGRFLVRLHHLCAVLLPFVARCGARRRRRRRC